MDNAINGGDLQMSSNDDLVFIQRKIDPENFLIDPSKEVPGSFYPKLRLE